MIPVTDIYDPVPDVALFNLEDYFEKQVNKEDISGAVFNQTFIAEAPAIIICCADIKGYIAGSVTGSQDLGKINAVENRIVEILSKRIDLLKTYTIVIYADNHVPGLNDYERRQKKNMKSFRFIAATSQPQLRSRWSLRPSANWFSQCSHLLPERFRYSSSVSGPLDLESSQGCCRQFVRSMIYST